MKLSRREEEGGGSLVSFFKDQAGGVSHHLGQTLSTAKKRVLEEVKNGSLIPAKVHDEEDDDDVDDAGRHALISRFVVILEEQLMERGHLKNDVDIYIDKIQQMIM